MLCKASLQGMPKDLDRMRSGLAIKPNGPDAARCCITLLQTKSFIHDLRFTGCCWHKSQPGKDAMTDDLLMKH